MTTKFVLYMLVSVAVIWSMESININAIFKKKRVTQARLFYFFITISIIYLVTNFIYDLYLNL